MSSNKKQFGLSTVGHKKVLDVIRTHLYNKVECLVANNLGKDKLVLGTSLLIGIGIEVVVQVEENTDEPRVLIVDEFGDNKSEWLN